MADEMDDETHLSVELAEAAEEELDRWKGKADCSELGGFLGPSGEPECQGGDEVPSQPMCLTHMIQAAERDAAKWEALAKKGQQLREELEEVGNHAVGIIWDPALLDEWDALNAPAEAQEEAPE